MLQGKFIGLTNAAIAEQPIKEIVRLLFEYQHKHESACYGWPRGLALASDMHAILEFLPYTYKLWYDDRHLTISVYKVRKDNSLMEVMRIRETERTNA